MVSEKSLEYITEKLRKFIELSMQDDEIAWDEFLSSYPLNSLINCWESKSCSEGDCPAYKNRSGRCWLVAGTMCGGEVCGKFAKKYHSCTECEVYQKTVNKDPVTELQELIAILIYSMRSEHLELKEALKKVKLLSGFLPICSSCKKIRDDKGYWNQIEEYIKDHSDAKFTHGICPKCAEELYPDLYKEVVSDNKNN